MKKFSLDPTNTIIVNATNIGYKFHGIGVYSLKIIKGLTELHTDLKFVVYLNKSCSSHMSEIHFPENFKVKWVSEKISPDRKFKGHLLRLIFSNLLSIKYRKFLVYNTSQLEINFFRSNQVVTIHDVIPLLFKEFHKKQYPYFKLILKYGLKYAQFILTPSNHSKAQLQKIYDIPDDKIKVIYNGADGVESISDRKQFDAGKYILYVGRINRMKNIRGVLKAYDLITERIEEKLVIIGNDRNAYTYEIKAAGLKSETRDKIVFRENISESEKYDLMSNASLFLYPSLYEGFGLSPVEAMACGCPVVVSRNSSLTEVCGNAAYYINPVDYSEIADVVIEVLSNEQLKSQMSQEGLLQAKRFNWADSSFQHLKVLESVLQHSKFPQQNPLEVRPTLQNIDSIILNTLNARQQ